MHFPGGSVVKNPPANAGDTGLIPWWEQSPGEGNDNFSCILAWKNPMDRGTWQDVFHGVTKESDMTYQLNNNKTTRICLFFFSFWVNILRFMVCSFRL